MNGETEMNDPVNDPVTHGLPFLAWWEELNNALADRNRAGALLGEARCWFGRSYWPSTAAELIIEERDAA